MYGFADIRVARAAAWTLRADENPHVVLQVLARGERTRTDRAQRSAVLAGQRRPVQRGD